MRASHCNQALRAVRLRRFALIALRTRVRGIVALAPLFGIALPAFSATHRVRAAEPPALAALAGNDLLRDAPDATVSVNAAWERGERDTWFIEQQRYGADFVTAGLFTGMMQRLSAAGTSCNYLYVAHAGYPGDCGDYQGHLTTINLGTSEQKVFNTMCSNQTVHFAAKGKVPDFGIVQSAVWARQGVVYLPDTDRVYFTTGNAVWHPRGKPRCREWCSAPDR